MSLLLAILFASHVIGNQLRGIPPNLESFYNPVSKDAIDIEAQGREKLGVGSKELFQCIYSREYIPFSRVNDYYCDCRDGSDEPGTNACPAQWFYCRNEGFKPKNISSGLVDDGVCDCCDGSDEGILVQCPNTCAQLQRDVDYISVERDRVRQLGVVAKMKMIREGRAALTEMERKRKLLSNSVTHLEELVQRLKDIWSQSGKPEIPTVKVQDLEGRVKFLENIIQSTLAAARRQKSPHSTGSEQLDSVEDESNEEDNGVDSPIRSLEHRWMKYKRRSWLIEGNDTRPEETWISYIHSFFSSFYGSSIDYAYYGYSRILAWVPWLENSWIIPSRVTVHTFLKDWGFISIMTPLMEHDLKDLSERLAQEQHEIKVAGDHFSRNYGHNCEFYSLENDSCFHIVQDGYDYELCMYGEAKQKSIDDSGSGVLLGKWEGFTDDNMTVARFSKGARCYSGEVRQLEVIFTCGESNRLESVSEPSRCSYQATFSTPAVCQERPEDIKLYQDDAEMLNLFQVIMNAQGKNGCDCDIQQGSMMEEPPQAFEPALNIEHQEL
jgi:protein kinase C substrate 80K-H